MVKILFLLILFSQALFSDTYHNINGFIGERAAGLGGAYTAISDDPSGGFYNPAGLAFAFDNFISISANTYTQTKKTYQNVFGPGADYNRKSEGFNPNFIGTVKSFDKIKVGLSIITPSNDRFDQADNFYVPPYRPSLGSFRIDYTEEYKKFMIGPSIATTITDKISVGASLFLTNDYQKIISTQVIEGRSGNYRNVTTQDRRNSNALTPVIGIQIMPKEKLSFGLSMKRIINVSGTRSVTGFTTDNNTSNYGLATITNSTHNNSSLISGGTILMGPYENYKIPQTTEIRAGAAYFASTNSLIAFDVIYTDGYKSSHNRNWISINSPGAIIRDSNDPYMERAPTLNYAMGAEYFLTEILALRVGLFTNYANTRKIDWASRAIDVALVENNKSTIPLGSNAMYQPNSIQPLTRFEHVDNKGMSLGFSWTTSKSSITLSYVLERGKGSAQIDSSQLPQSMLFNSSSIYLVASSHN